MISALAAVKLKLFSSNVNAFLSTANLKIFCKQKRKRFIKSFRGSVMILMWEKGSEGTRNEEFWGNFRIERDEIICRETYKTSSNRRRVVQNRQITTNREPRELTKTRLSYKSNEKKRENLNQASNITKIVCILWRFQLFFSSSWIEQMTQFSVL